MLYLLIIGICALIIYVINALVNPANVSLPWVYYLVAVIIMIASQVLIDAIIAIIGRALPEKFVNPRKGMILTRDWEMKFFTFLRVKNWKDYMPDLGRFTNFPKGNLMDPYNNEYIARYILEASYGVWIHYMSVPASLIVFFLAFIPEVRPTIWTVGIPVVIVNMILILLPAFTLKYNLPRLIRIYDMNERLLKKKEAMRNED